MLAQLAQAGALSVPEVSSAAVTLRARAIADMQAQTTTALARVDVAVEDIVEVGRSS